MKSLILHIILLAFSVCLCAQNEQMHDSIPKVSKIGEYEAYYNGLYENYNNPLLSVCQDDMDLAYDKWTNMLKDMEDYSNQVSFDLKGLKLWIYVFWEKNGEIKHLMFYPMPNSRNSDLDELSVFFNSFINNYQMSVNTDIRFNHTGSATFPVYPKRIMSAEK